MNHKITAEWLQSFGDDDYEPSGLMTPRDHTELERRQADRLQVGEQNIENVEKAHDSEQAVVVAK